MKDGLRQRPRRKPRRRPVLLVVLCVLAVVVPLVATVLVLYRFSAAQTPEVRSTVPPPREGRRIEKARPEAKTGRNEPERPDAKTTGQAEPVRPVTKTGVKLLLSEDFEGGKVKTPGLTFVPAEAAYEPATRQQPFVKRDGRWCGHYFAKRGTNEQTPWQIVCEPGSMERLIGVPELSEFCLEWQELFADGFPWPTSGQKIVRFGYDGGSRNTASKKSIGFQSLTSNGNLQVEAHLGQWGDKTHGVVDWAKNTGEAHPMDVWVRWRLWVRLNTPGKSDGFIRVFKDGKPFITENELNLRGTDTHGFNFFWIGGNSSMAGGKGALANDGHRYISGVRLWSIWPE